MKEIADPKEAFCDNWNLRAGRIVAGLGAGGYAASICTIISVGKCDAAFALLPWIAPRFFRRFGDRLSELEAKSNYRWATGILMPSLKT